MHRKAHSKKGVIKMKCQNCGARVKKIEEICPECGAYISREAEPSALPVRSENEVEINLEKEEEKIINIDEGSPEEYNFKNFLLLPSILRFGGGIALFIVCILSFGSKKYLFRASSVYSLMLCLFLAAFLIFNGIASIVQESKCRLTINNKRVYGTIPLGIFDTQHIDVNIADIISVNETGFHSRYPNPEVHIVTKEEEFVVKGSSGTMLKNFSNTLQKKMKGETE